MRVTKTELYDRYYSVYPDKAKLYRGDTEMPKPLPQQGHILFC